MYVLQYIFTPHIQRDLTTVENFQVSMEHISSNITARNNNCRRYINEIRDLSQEFIATCNLVELEDISIVLPCYEASLTLGQRQLLNNDFDLLGDSPHEGIDIYGSYEHIEYKLTSSMIIS